MKRLFLPVAPKAASPTMSVRLSLTGWMTTLALAGCGGVALSGAGTDGGSDGHGGGLDGGHGTYPFVDGGSPGHPGKDAGLRPPPGTDAGPKKPPPGTDGGSPDALVYVDAGVYRGDGSFFVDGGAYPDASGGKDATSPDDALALDATPGCAALAACCSTLQPSSQSLCTDVASQGNAANCATELTQLQSEGDCTGQSVLATQVQATPNRMVSDGTLLFWTTGVTPGLLAMPVTGGSITTVVSGAVGNSQGGVFLAVDALNIYTLIGSDLVRIPRDGSAATLISASGAQVEGATALGTNAYWIELSPSSSGNPRPPFTIKGAPLTGGPLSLDVTVSTSAPFLGIIGVTPSAVVVGMPAATTFYFPMSGPPPAGPTEVDEAGMGVACGTLSSGTDAVYCTESTGDNLRIASDGSVTNLGAIVNSSSFIVSDDTYVYWVEEGTVGTINKAPKAGGGPVTVLAHDTSPTAIAVDDHAVYWGDQGGYIKSIAK